MLIIYFFFVVYRSFQVYPGSKNAIYNRVALLITNVTFTNKLYNRYGAEKDEKDMETLLKGLRYEVVKHRDLTGQVCGETGNKAPERLLPRLTVLLPLQGIEDAIVAFSKHPKLKDTDSVVMVIMSHGKLGAVVGVNHGSEEDYFYLDNIYELLGPEKCRALIDKPKVIIVQACRGGDDSADVDQTILLLT